MGSESVPHYTRRRAPLFAFSVSPFLCHLKFLQRVSRSVEDEEDEEEKWEDVEEAEEDMVKVSTPSS